MGIPVCADGLLYNSLRLYKVELMTLLDMPIGVSTCLFNFVVNVTMKVVTLLLVKVKVKVLVYESNTTSIFHKESDICAIPGVKI